MSSTNTTTGTHRRIQQRMPPVENIMLSGGGIFGLCYSGVFRYMEEQGIRAGIRRVLGVSVGSIFGFLFCLKIPAEHIHRLVDQFGPDDIKDFDTEHILHFFEHFGLDTGVKIERFIKACAKVKLGNPDATFADLYAIHPDMEYIVMGAEITECSRKYFSYKTTPDYPIWRAVRISCSIPLYFRPVIENDKIYVDGAVVCNYPIDYFRDDLDHTLGFKFEEYIPDSTTATSSTSSEDISATTVTTTHNIDFYKYFTHLFETMVYSFERYMATHYDDYTVRIRVPKRVMYDYALPVDTKQRYYTAGYNDMRDKWIARCKKYTLDDDDDNGDRDDRDNGDRDDRGNGDRDDRDDTGCGDVINLSDDDIDIESITQSLRE